MGTGTGNTHSAWKYKEKVNQQNQKDMAKVTDVFLNGAVGNLVFYRRMGINCARAKASHVTQSAATKIRSVNFGIAARAGKALRGGLAPCMPVATDRSMQSRFSGAIAKWLANCPF